MTPQKIKEVCTLYRKRFEAENIPKRRLAVDRYPETAAEMLAHAHYLLDGVEVLADDPEKVGKTGRHLGSIQMLLWASKWYTLEELMNHNCPA